MRPSSVRRERAVLVHRGARASAALAWSFTALACASTSALDPQSTEHEFVERHMGCTARVVLHEADEERARELAHAAFAVIARADELLSDYRSDSLASSISAHAGDATWIDVPEDVAELLERSRELSEHTQGAFDVTIGPLTKLWREARRVKALPAADLVARTRELVDVRDLHVELAPPRARLARNGMALDFGGIGKGWAADAALETLRELGCASALVQIEGDIALGDAPPGRRGWIVGAEGGARLLELARCGVSTSGDESQHLDAGGARRSHIVDPRTGQATTSSVRVTLVAPDATTADALATAFSVLGAERARPLAESLPSVSACLEERRGREIVRVATRGYDALPRANARGALE